MIKKGFPLLLLTLWASLSTAAEDQKAGWSGSSELGIIFTRGNTETTSAKGRVDLEQNLEDWINEFSIDALFKEDEVVDETTGEEETEKTAEKYFAYAKTNYKLKDDHSKLFAYLSHTDDQFAGVAKNTTVAFGYGRRLVETDNTYLDADIGPGYSFSEQADGEDVEDFIIRVSAKYHWKISESATFIQKLSSEIGEENTRTLAESSLATKINSALQMKIGLVVTNNSDVPEETEKTDTETTVTLVYSF
ncbi:MAG: DUF481 domain-containing protein [Exilibacterium sp.]